MIFSTNEELQDALALWQKRLRLQDWNVVAEFKCASWMGDHDANILVTVPKKCAHMGILDPRHIEGARAGSVWPMDQEKDLVHELVHLHIEPFAPDQESNPTKYELFEQSVDILARALVAGYRQ